MIKNEFTARFYNSPIEMVNGEFSGLLVLATHITLDRHFSFRNKLLVFKILIL